LKIDFIYLANKINEQPMSERDIEKVYSKDEFIAKLRRLADAIEQNENFRISIAGEAIYVPDRATFSIEHERGDGEHEIEFQIKWQDQ
jgi:amphi-Trp domain-containing protein